MSFFNLSLWAVLFFAIPISSAMAVMATKLHVILVVDSFSGKHGRADLAPACEASANFYRALFEGGLKEDQVSLEVISDERASAQGLRDFLNDLEVKPTENIFVFYCGHGAVKEGTNDEQYFLFGQGGNMARNEVRYLMLKKKPQAAILVSDACMLYQQVTLAPRMPGIEFTALEDLFLNVDGVVDISAASPGEPAWFTNGGGIFSQGFEEAVSRDKKDLDTNRDGFVSWEEVLARTKVLTGARFKEHRAKAVAGADGKPGALKKAKLQVPSAYFLNKKVLFLKSLQAKNAFAEKVTLNLHVQTIDEKGELRWYPQDPSVNNRGYVFELAAGQALNLSYPTQPPQPVYAHSVRYEIFGAAGRLVEPVEQLGGYAAYVPQIAGKYDTWELVLTK